MLPAEIAKALEARFPSVTLEETTQAILVPKDMLLKLAECLKEEPFAFDDLHCITGVDNKETFQIIYLFDSTPKHHTLTVKTSVERTKPSVDSLAGLWKSADWLERETYDFFGITFINHPDLRRILNSDDFKGFPLRKDYVNPDFISLPRATGPGPAGTG